MNAKVINVAIFVAGVAIGSVVTWVAVKNKYRKIADEEIASMKEVISRKQPEEVPAKEEPKEEPSMTEYAKMLNQMRYSEEEGGSTMKGPYVISPDEFNEHDEYQKETLTYYSDTVLTDDWDNPITDIDGTVGDDFAIHFGEFEDDSVFIRNDKLRTDYEILRDWRKFTDVVGVDE